MIQGFEKQTSELNTEELSMAFIVAKGLSTKHGKAKAIKNATMVKAMRDAGYNLSEARLRKIINYIRVNDLVPCLVATSAGYYVSNDIEELHNYCDSLRERASAIMQVQTAILRQIDKLKGQVQTSFNF